MGNLLYVLVGVSFVVLAAHMFILIMVWNERKSVSTSPLPDGRVLIVARYSMTAYALYIYDPKVDKAVAAGTSFISVVNT